MEQRDLFASLKKPPTTTEVKGLVSLATKRVADGRAKYTPVNMAGLPKYAELRTRIIATQQAVQNGRLIADDSFKMLRTKDELHKALDGVRTSKILPWDCEFDTLEYMLAQMVGLSFTDRENDLHFYVPFLHCDAQRNLIENQLSYNDFIEVAGDIWNSPKIRKVTHQYAGCDNIVFQNNFGVEVRGQYWDTLLFQNAIDENFKDKSLKNLYAHYVTEGDKEANFNELFGDLSFAFVPLDVAHIYGAKDAKMTDSVYEEQLKILSAPEYRVMLKHYIETEAAQLEVITGMHLHGVEINEPITNELVDEYSILEKELKETLNTFFFSNFKIDNINYNSPVQMDKLLYDVLKLAPVGKVKNKETGEREKGTGDDIIEKLIAKNPDVKIIKNISLLRSTEKLLSTYLNGIPAKRSTKDNRVHGILLSHGAATGRYSSRDPNLQNIPAYPNKDTGKDDSRVRQMFRPREGYVWLSSDYSQIEPRILAVRCMDQSMLEAYNSGRDLYSVMASQIFKVSYEDCLEKNGKEAKARRSITKFILLGIMYGRQAASIAEQASITKKEAENVIATFFDNYPSVKNYIDETIRMGKLLGYVTTIYERRRRLPALNSPNDFIRAEAERQAVNATIQGSSADITKRAMWKVKQDDWLKDNDCHLVLTIHDELVVETPKAIINEAGLVIKNRMIEAADILTPHMPIKCDVECFTDCWNDPNSYKLAL